MVQRWPSRLFAAAVLTWGAMVSANAAAPGPGPGPGLNEPGGSGPFPAAATTTPQLPQHTLYHPVEMPRQALRLYVWGNGGCSDNGLSHARYLREIASRRYFVIALGAPRPGGAAGGAAPAPAPRGAPPPGQR